MDAFWAVIDYLDWWIAGAFFFAGLVALGKLYQMFLVPCEESYKQDRNRRYISDTTADESWFMYRVGVIAACVCLLAFAACFWKISVCAVAAFFVCRAIFNIGRVHEISKSELAKELAAANAKLDKIAKAEGLDQVPYVPKG